MTLVRTNPHHHTNCVESIVHEMRHLDGIKGNFMINESEYLDPLTLFEKGKIAPQIIYSNQKEIVEQHQYMFDTLWSKAILAEQRIKELEDDTIEEEQHYQTRLLENQDEIIKEIKRRIILLLSIVSIILSSTIQLF